jgi:predicted transcriptional regulator YheO
MKLSSYTPLCDAIVLLMEPLLEIVIHDLESDSICYISSGFSKRQVGDPSFLEGQEFEKELDKVVYSKLNFDGRLIKSISVPLEKKWLLCINCDISIFNQMKDFSERFLNHREFEKPESLFKNDWQEKLHIVIHRFLTEEHWSFNELGISQKKKLVKHLFDCGAFREKGAADYIADILNLGRATVFNYLKEWRNV